MNPIPYIDIHTHPFRQEKDTITVQNIYPGEGFAAFSGRNFYSVGLHPWHIKDHDQNNDLLELVQEALDFDHVIFIGECGLDKRCETSYEEQFRVFRAQAFMAEEYRKPLLIHCVKAYQDLIGLHKEMHPEVPWILHGYNGSVEITRQLVQRGMCLSFGANLFKEGARARKSFSEVSLDKVFFETDEFEGDVERMYHEGASIRKMDVEELKKKCWQNFNRIESASTNLF